MIKVQREDVAVFNMKIIFPTLFVFIFFFFSNLIFIYFGVKQDGANLSQAYARHARPSFSINSSLPLHVPVNGTGTVVALEISSEISVLKLPRGIIIDVAIELGCLTPLSLLN